MKSFKPVKIYLSPDKELFRTIKNIFGFYPDNIFLYKLAFRHRSAAQELFNGVKVSNERLEYLGDAVLNLVVADYLYKTFPFKDEGFLTQMRSKIVSRAQLNDLSRKLGLDRLIQKSQNSLSQFRSIAGDTFEAFIGAMYFDRGYEFTKKIIINRIIKFHLDIDEIETMDVNPKSTLLEWTQKMKKMLDFRVIEEVGTGPRKQYIVEAYIDDIPSGKGQDFSIKGAEQLAAEKACNSIFQTEP
ncbi:MAG: ribonuclease III [Bacteroidetes bacterium]|nr:ribonuclease III [Bacteroidota bacterium]